MLLTKETLVEANPRQKYPMPTPQASTTNMRHQKFVTGVRYSSVRLNEEIMEATKYACIGDEADIMH